MLLKKNKLIAIMFAIYLLQVFDAYSSENIQPKYKKNLISFNLPRPFGYTVVNAELKNNNRLGSVNAKYSDYDISINTDELKDLVNVDLNGMEVYEGVLLEAQEAENVVQESLQYFSLCFNYGDFKKGLRLNRPGWYRDVLQIVFYPDGKFETKNYLVEAQNVPVSPCWN